MGNIWLLLWWVHLNILTVLIIYKIAFLFCGWRLHMMKYRTKKSGLRWGNLNRRVKWQSLTNLNWTNVSMWLKICLWMRIFLLFTTTQTMLLPLRLLPHTDVVIRTLLKTRWRAQDWNRGASSFDFYSQPRHSKPFDRNRLFGLHYSDGKFVVFQDIRGLLMEEPDPTLEQEFFFLFGLPCCYLIIL